MTSRNRATRDVLKRRWDALLDVSPDLVFWLSPAGQYLDFHATNPEQLLANPETIIGRYIHELVPPDQAAEAMGAIDRTMATGRVASYEYTLDLPIGTLNFEARLLGAGDEVVALVRDITTRVDAQRQVERDAHYFEALIADAFDMTVAVDSLGRITFASKAVEKALGRSAKQLTGSPLQDLVHPDERVDARTEFIRLLAHPGARGPIERRLIDTNGIGHTCEVVATNLLHDPAVNAIVYHARDISQRLATQAAILERERELAVIRAERDRATLEARLRQAQRLESTGRLAAGVAHDFTNLIGVALNYVSVLERSALSEAQRSDLDAIRQSAQLAADLAQRLLQLGRADAGHSEALDLCEVVEAMRFLAHSSIGREGPTLEIVAPNGPVTVRADRGQIEQVIMNLLMNARDATTADGTIVIKLETISEPTGIVAQLVVSDNGRGMTQHTADRAFDPFFTTKAHGMGTGLGLSVVDGIVAGCGGTISIASEVAVGTTVTISWPPARASHR